MVGRFFMSVFMSRSPLIELLSPARLMPGLACVAVSACLVTSDAYAQNHACSAEGELQWTALKKVVDGDTLHLTDGRKVRLIAVNTPELARKHTPAQPLADKARRAVTAFFAADTRVGVQSGRQSQDKHGRQLAHIFRSDGHSLAAYLLSKGLAWHIVVPPNDRYWQCLANNEQLAQQQSLGIWAEAVYALKPAEQLTVSDTGFQRVRGKVRSVSRSRNGWWVQMGKLALQLRDKDMHYFSGINPDDWQGQWLTVRGWIIDRSQSKSVQQKGYAPFMLTLRHPLMLK